MDRKTIINIDLPLLLDASLFIARGNIQYYGNYSFAFPTGRPNDTDFVAHDRFISLVQMVKNGGSEFNYLLNGDLSDLDVASFYEYFFWIINEVKPNVITFSDPKIYQYILKNFDYKNFEISAIVGIKSRRDFDIFISRNRINISHISKLVFHHDITMDFNGLMSFNKFLKKENIHSRVLVTESCYNKCPLRKLHYNSFVEAYRNPNKKFFNHYQVYCISKRLMRPSSLLDLSGFLLPEQIQDYYNATGINAFKISGRSESAEWIYNTAQRYINGKSPNNIFEIIVFTAPFLDEIGLKVSDLFYLDPKAYIQLYKCLKTIEAKIDKKVFLESKAIELFKNGAFRVNDPNSVYDIVDGQLRVIKYGDYLKLLMEKSIFNTSEDVYYKSIISM